MIVVLWVVAMASLVGLTLATSMRSEVQVAIAERDVLTAELLAESGLAFATYLGADNLTVGRASVAGIPVETVADGFHYRIDLPEGPIDLFLEGEDGKINLSSAPQALIERFFTLWTGNTDRGQELAGAVLDWRDGDDRLSLRGAESFAYANMGYAPRNGPLGAADLLLIRGIDRSDFIPAVSREADGFAVRPGLGAFVTTEAGGPALDPNLAPRLALLAIPGMTESIAVAITTSREDRYYRSLEELTRVTGPLPAGVAAHLRFGASASPAVLSVGRTPGGVVRSIRRKISFRFETNTFTGAVFSNAFNDRIERDALPEFARAAR